ncbi:MAG: DUF1016 family protein [Bacteroidetes bacterium]|nr:DUF1016 family protein [Candidatus Colenecus caballi]MCQ2127718.1 PDDEXK nuclease domain-containing protein [Bacteroidaceae bacterium]
MNDEHNKQIPEYDENLSVVNWDNLNEIGFDELVSAILNIDGSAQTSAVKAINRMQTMRNWFIGYYIVEYEQKGKERATYGAGLLKKLEKRVARKGLTETLFKWSRTFYRLYPQIRTLVSTAYSIDAPKSASVMHEFKTSDNMPVEKCTSVMSKFISTAEDIINKLSFTHLREIMTIDDPTIRYFYEQECMRGTWSVRELRRQISSNLHIRIGLSKNPEKLLSMYQDGKDAAKLQIRDPYTFEFLGLSARDVITETDLEDALISHLQDFLLEFGKGMCFEARQKRIIIDDEYYYPDLIFYNRLGHFSLIVELKNEAFSHENLGQLNAYVSYWKEVEMQPGDNPPVGLLLCTEKGKKMVEYTLANMDNRLFVSTYQLQLPDKKVLEDFLIRQLEENKNVK